MFVRDSKFRHVFPQESKVKFEDMKSSGTASESSLVKSNGFYAACSWSTAGGSLGILNLANPIRIPHNYPLIRGHHGPVLDSDFYPFNPQFVATCSEDSTIKLWEFPEGGLT
mmetsp:Transcript_6966/g.3882  ORF Transcript_6966/g.3882 Transcript_6966/m.3882 type:complete len:112 (-) Transcript_6966:1803-2138(-)